MKLDEVPIEINAVETVGGFTWEVNLAGRRLREVGGAWPNEAEAIERGVEAFLLATRTALVVRPGRPSSRGYVALLKEVMA